MIDRATSNYPEHTKDEDWRVTLEAALPPERTLGKLAAGEAFDMFCAWLDSGNTDLTHFMIGQSMPEAAIIQFPDAADNPMVRHDLAS